MPCYEISYARMESEIQSFSPSELVLMCVPPMRNTLFLMHDSFVSHRRKVSERLQALKALIRIISSGKLNFRTGINTRSILAVGRRTPVSFFVSCVLSEMYYQLLRSYTLSYPLFNANAMIEAVLFRIQNKGSSPRDVNVSPSAGMFIVLLCDKFSIGITRINLFRSIASHITVVPTDLNTNPDDLICSDCSSGSLAQIQVTISTIQFIGQVGRLYASTKWWDDRKLNAQTNDLGRNRAEQCERSTPSFCEQKRVID